MNERKQQRSAQLAVQLVWSTAYFKIIDQTPMDGGTGTVVAFSGPTGTDWLEMGSYIAIFIDGDMQTWGSLAVYDCQSSSEGVRFAGIWREAKE